MALVPVLACGAECGLSASGGHLILSGTASFDTATVNNGLRSIRTNPTAGSGKALFSLASSNIFVSRHYINVASDPITISESVCGIAPTGRQVGLGFNVIDSKYYPCEDDGTTCTLGSSGVTLSAGWHCVDMKVDISANPWTIDVAVDGTALTQLTRALAATTATNFYLGCDVRATSTLDIYWDDLIVSNTAVDYPIGAGKVLASSPVADGTHVATPAGIFVRGVAGGANIISTGTPTTDSYLLIDDVPLSSGAASDFITQVTSEPNSYVSHLYATATATDGPRAVEVIYRSHKVTTAAGGFRFKLLDNGVTALIQNYLSSAAGSSGPTYFRLQMASMVGGGSWTLARYNLIQTRWGYSTDANPDVSLDAVMFEAEFQVQTTQAQAVTATNNFGVGVLTLNAAAPNLTMWTPIGAALYGYP